MVLGRKETSYSEGFDMTRGLIDNTALTTLPERVRQWYENLPNALVLFIIKHQLKPNNLGKLLEQIDIANHIIKDYGQLPKLNPSIETLFYNATQYCLTTIATTHQYRNITVKDLNSFLDELHFLCKNEWHVKGTPGSNLEDQLADLLNFIIPDSISQWQINRKTLPTILNFARIVYQYELDKTYPRLANSLSDLFGQYIPDAAVNFPNFETYLKYFISPATGIPTYDMQMQLAAAKIEYLSSFAPLSSQEMHQTQILTSNALDLKTSIQGFLNKKLNPKQKTKFLNLLVDIFTRSKKLLFQPPRFNLSANDPTIYCCQILSELSAEDLKLLNLAIENIKEDVEKNSELNLVLNILGFSCKWIIEYPTQSNPKKCFQFAKNKFEFLLKKLSPDSELAKISIVVLNQITTILEGNKENPDWQFLINDGFELAILILNNQEWDVENKIEKLKFLSQQIALRIKTPNPSPDPIALKVEELQLLFQASLLDSAEGILMESDSPFYCTRIELFSVINSLTNPAIKFADQDEGLALLERFKEHFLATRYNDLIKCYNRINDCLYPNGSGIGVVYNQARKDYVDTVLNTQKNGLKRSFNKLILDSNPQARLSKIYIFQLLQNCDYLDETYFDSIELKKLLTIKLTNLKIAIDSKNYIAIERHYQEINDSCGNELVKNISRYPYLYVIHCLEGLQTKRPTISNSHKINQILILCQRLDEFRVCPSIWQEIIGVISEAHSSITNSSAHNIKAKLDQIYLALERNVNVLQKSTLVDGKPTATLFNFLKAYAEAETQLKKLKGNPLAKLYKNVLESLYNGALNAPIPNWQLLKTILFLTSLLIRGASTLDTHQIQKQLLEYSNALKGRRPNLSQSINMLLQQLPPAPKNKIELSKPKSEHKATPSPTSLFLKSLTKFLEKSQAESEHQKVKVEIFGAARQIFNTSQVESITLLLNSFEVTADGEDLTWTKRALYQTLINISNEMICDPSQRNFTLLESLIPLVSYLKGKASNDDLEPFEKFINYSHQLAKLDKNSKEHLDLWLSAREYFRENLSGKYSSIWAQRLTNSFSPSLSTNKCSLMPAVKQVTQTKVEASQHIHQSRTRDLTN